MEGEIRDPTSGTAEMEMRQRLMSLDEEPETAFRPNREWHCRNRKPRLLSPDFLFRMLTISFLICLFTIGIDHWSRCHRVTAQLNHFQTPITNNKVFHHNRTTPAALAAAAKQKPSKSEEKSKNNKKPSAKSDGGQRPQPPHHPSSSHNIIKSAMNILSMSLRPPTTPKSTGWTHDGANQRPQSRNPGLKMSPSPPVSPFRPTPLHPLAVLKTQSNFSRETSSGDPPNDKGRSTFDFEPLFESGTESNGRNETGKSGQNLKPGFFDKFEDHWDDPMAEESAPNSFNVLEPPFRPGLSPSIIRPPLTHGQWNPSPGSNYVTQKHVNYWPANLNSYYGIQKPFGRRPGEVPGHRPVYHNDHHHHRDVDNHFDGTQNHYDHEEEPGGSLESESVNNYKKTTVMERVSVFYSEYKILAWAIVVVVAAVVALGALVGLYLNNPPTEVVSARSELERAISNPQLLTFLDSLSRSSSSRKKGHGSGQSGQKT